MNKTDSIGEDIQAKSQSKNYLTFTSQTIFLIPIIQK